MLTELTIIDFAIIENLHLTFTPGFNVLTGETGAGKSIIIDAVTMLLGGRADTTFIRAGSDRARIEAVFRLSPALRPLIDPILEREGLEPDEPDLLILGRELRSNGRSFCRVNGVTANLSLLEEVAQPLIDIHGQSEHLSLLQVRHHQRFLDRYAGLDDLRNRVLAQMRQLRRVRQELKELRQDQQRTARRIDQLTYQSEEIQAANLQPTEEEELNIERNRLANAEQLSQLTAELYRLLVESEGDEMPCAVDLLGQAARVMAGLVKLDETLAGPRNTLDELIYQLEDLGGQVRDYAEAVDYNPARLQEVEERLGLIYNLKRKYGNSIAEILEFGRKAQAELENLSHSEERIEAMQAEEESLRYSLGRLALELSQARRVGGDTLSLGVVAQLADLSMERAAFAVDIQWDETPDGVYVDTGSGPKTLACDERGIDRIEFLIAANPGEPLKPLVKVASGGETSRVMLALKTVLASADDTPTLIFDEIDQGIGGRVGGVVGRKLCDLAHGGGHQVLCVTHLPQIAGYGDVHYHVSKHVQDNRTMTGVRRLAGDERVEELAQMLGLPSDSTRQSAREILHQAASGQCSRSQ
jgi:DNA repair protein RecN (Recombination protein N)